MSSQSQVVTPTDPAQLPDKTSTSDTSNQVSGISTAQRTEHLQIIKNPKRSRARGVTKQRAKRMSRGDPNQRRNCPVHSENGTYSGRVNSGVSVNGNQCRWHRLKSRFLTVLNSPTSNSHKESSSQWHTDLTSHCHKEFSSHCHKTSSSNCHKESSSKCQTEPSSTWHKEFTSHRFKDCTSHSHLRHDFPKKGGKPSISGERTGRYCKRRAARDRRHRSEDQISASELARLSQELSLNVKYLSEITQQQSALNNLLLYCFNHHDHDRRVDESIPLYDSQQTPAQDSSSFLIASLGRMIRKLTGRNSKRRRPRFLLPPLPRVEDLKSEAEIEWELPLLPKTHIPTASSTVIASLYPIHHDDTSDASPNHLRLKASRVAHEVQSLVKIYEQNLDSREPHLLPSFAAWYLTTKPKIKMEPNNYDEHTEY